MTISLACKFKFLGLFVWVAVAHDDNIIPTTLIITSTMCLDSYTCGFGGNHVDIHMGRYLSINLNLLQNLITIKYIHNPYCPCVGLYNTRKFIFTIWSKSNAKILLISVYYHLELVEIFIFRLIVTIRATYQRYAS